MLISKQRFCINRKIAPNLNIEAFFKLVNKCGLNKVELRNDMPDGSVTGNLSITELNNLAIKYDVEIVTINALGRFNLPEYQAQLLKETQAMLGLAKAINCQAIVLCPHCSADDKRTPEQQHADTQAALEQLGPLFDAYSIQGLVEPLGFDISSLRSSLLTQTIIRNNGHPFKMVMDTFHHHLSSTSLDEFSKNIDINRIGLVHLSGVEDLRPIGQLSDEERIMLSDKDVLNSKQQVVNLERLGYKGLYSFEPFSSTLSDWTEKDIQTAILDSINYLNQ